MAATIIWGILFGVFGTYCYAKSSDPYFAPEIGPLAVFIFFGSVYTVIYFIVALIVTGLIAANIGRGLIETD